MPRWKGGVCSMAWRRAFPPGRQPSSDECCRGLCALFTPRDERNRADQIGAGAGAGSSEVNAACRGAAGIIARRGGGGGEECEEQKARRCLQPGPFNSCGEAGGAGGDRPAAGVLEDSNGR